MGDPLIRGGTVVDGTRCWGMHDRGVLAPGYAADLAGEDRASGLGE